MAGLDGVVAGGGGMHMSPGGMVGGTQGGPTATGFGAARSGGERDQRFEYGRASYWEIFSGQFPGDPSVLDEMDVNVEQIKYKMKLALNPFATPAVGGADHSAMMDTDMAGPLMSVLLLGFALMLRGHFQFGYIYGFVVVGALLIYALFKLVNGGDHLTGLAQAPTGGTVATEVSFLRTLSVLGYCLLPMTLAALAQLLLFSISGVLGAIVGFTCVVWCTVCATKMFCSMMGNADKKLILGYPLLLLYGTFWLLSVF